MFLCDIKASRLKHFETSHSIAVFEEAAFISTCDLNLIWEEEVNIKLNKSNVEL